MDDRETAVDIFKTAIEAVKPDRLIRKCVALTSTALRIGNHPFDLKPDTRIFVVGAGKASALMARAVEEVLGPHITGGKVIVKYGHLCECRRIKVLEAGHPYPDQAGVDATRDIVRICREAQEPDLVVCLWSGGGSALLADYPEGSTLTEWISFSKALVNSGATINEINCVRKHLSRVKGGQLAAMAHPASIISLALSDVIGDPLDVIASGPTVPDSTTFADAAQIVEKYGLAESAPRPLLERIFAGRLGAVSDTPKAGDPLLSRTTNIVIGNIRMALEAGLKSANDLGMEGVIVTDRLEGDAVSTAETVVNIARQQAREKTTSNRFCLLFGGETTLKVSGGGLGGRSQHLALVAARLLSGTKGITLLAGGTDGTDGPTDMAGAVVDGSTWAKDPELAERCLTNFASYTFFEKCGGHVFTGPTMTNVMDIIAVILEPQQVR